MFIGSRFVVQVYNKEIALRYGFRILNNRMADCKMPVIINQSFIGIHLEGNYMVALDDFPDLAIAGQYPVIQNNTLIGVQIRARELGYTILSPRFVNNKFHANGFNQKFVAIIDFTDFSELFAEGNDTIASNYYDFIVAPNNCNTAGFKRIGQSERFINKPSILYGSKLTCQLGDIVMNSQA